MSTDVSPKQSDVYLSAPGVICALGRGRAAVAEALFAGEPGGVRSGEIDGHGAQNAAFNRTPYIRGALR